MELEMLYEKIQNASDYRALTIPFTLMVLDILTGVFHAWSTGHLKSYRMREGLNRKVGEISVIIVGLIFTWAFSLPKYLIAGIITYVVLMELVSLSENLDKMKFPLPKFVKSALRNAEYKLQNEDPSKKEGEKK